MDLAAERSSMPFLAASMASAKPFSLPISPAAFSTRRIFCSSCSRMPLARLLKFQFLDLRSQDDTLDHQRVASGHRRHFRHGSRFLIFEFHLECTVVFA